MTDRWRHRRRLVYGTVAVCAFMLFVGAFDQSDRQVSSQLVIGAVSLWTVVLTSYVFGSTLDDRWRQDDQQLSDFGEEDGGAGGGGVGGGAGGAGWH